MYVINLLPWRSLQYVQRKRHFYIILISIGVSVMLFAIVMHHAINSHVLHQQQRNYYLTVIFKPYQEQENKRQQLLSKITSVKSLYGKQTQLSQFLNDLSRYLLKELYLTRISYKNDRIHLLGVAVSEALISQFVKNVLSNSPIKKIKLTQVKQNEESKQFPKEFTLQIDV